jgi:ATP-dependent Clp protease adaptor protein ClpS
LAILALELLLWYVWNIIFVKRFAAMKSFVDVDTSSRQYEEVDVLTAHEEPCSLIVWNDDVNTFEWVIETLIEICGHSAEQAEQCAMIIHTQGKYAVKHGMYEDLKPQCDAITERGIGATIELAVDS